MATYVCIQKNTDRYGNALSYILKDELGRTGEFKRDAVIALLQNKNNKFINLKLTSDNKVIFTNENVKIANKQVLSVHPSAVLAMLIVELNEENLRAFASQFYQELNYNYSYGKERQVLDRYLSNIEYGITHDNYLAMTKNSKNIRVIGVYENNKGRHIGYKIKNIGNQPIQYICGAYSIEGDHGEDILVHTKEVKTLYPNDKVAINKIDAVRLISQIGFGGMWENTLVKCGEITRGAGSPEEFMRYCFLDVPSMRVLKDRDRRYIMLSMGEILDIDGYAITPAADKLHRESQKGVKGILNKWFK